MSFYVFAFLFGSTTLFTLLGLFYVNKVKVYERRLRNEIAFAWDWTDRYRIVAEEFSKQMRDEQSFRDEMRIWIRLECRRHRENQDPNGLQEALMDRFQESENRLFHLRRQRLGLGNF